MSRSRTERLVNLVICLLSTRRYLTAAQIAATVPGYEHNPDDPKDHEAFQRKFERDKAELRELGVPLETGTPSLADAEPGYRIARREYALPAIALEPDEAAAVGIAARMWRHAGLAAAASSGLAKLRAAGLDVDPHATLGVQPVVVVEPQFEPLTAAIRERCPVSFAYRAPEQDTASTRRLRPWGVVCWRGRWYVVGYDQDRRAERCFRLSRIVGDVVRSGQPGSYQPPSGVDLISYVARWSGPTERTGRARIRVAAGRADGVRRWAEQVEPGSDCDVVHLRYGEAPAFARWLVGFGADVTVLEPPEVRDAVIHRLREVLQAHAPLTTAGAESPAAPGPAGPTAPEPAAAVPPAAGPAPAGSRQVADPAGPLAAVVR